MEIKRSGGQLILSEGSVETWQLVVLLIAAVGLVAFLLVTANISLNPWYIVIFLAGIGLYLVVQPSRTAVFDTTSKEMVLTTSTITGRQSQRIPFSEIAAIGVELRRWNNSEIPSYRIQAKLLAGQSVILTSWSGRFGGLPRSGWSWNSRDQEGLDDPVLVEHKEIADLLRQVVGIS